MSAQAQTPDAGAQGSAASPPLAVAQEALWLFQRLNPGAIAYNETISIRKDGDLELSALRRAFTEIVRRHHAWRTTYDTCRGRPVQILHPAPELALPVIDFSELEPAEAERRASALVAEVSSVPYDLRRGPLLRPRLIRFPGAHHRLYLAMHHIIFDGVSVYRVVLPELVALYEAFRAGNESPLPEASAQYGDYARWEQEWIEQPRIARRIEHWREHFERLPPGDVPADRPRPAEARFRGGVIPLTLSPEVVAGLRDQAQRTGATLFQALAGAWALLLARLTGRDRVVFSTAVDLRQRREFEALVGYCLSPLALIVEVGDAQNFAEVVVRVRNELLDGIDRLLPFERLVRELRPPAPPGANRVYQTMIVLEPLMASPDPSWSIHQMESEIGEAVASTKLDLELELDERPEGHLAGRLIYDRELFEPASAARIVELFCALAAAAVDSGGFALPPGRLLECRPEERRRQLVEWNATRIELGGGGVHRLVADRAAGDPQAVAVRCGGLCLTYAELVLEMRKLGEQLREQGAGLDQTLGTRLPQGPTRFLHALAALQAGAEHLLLEGSGGELARIGHASLLNTASAMAGALDLGPGDEVLVLDAAAIREPAITILPALIAGATVLLIGEDEDRDPERIATRVASERIGLVHASALQWQALIDAGLRPARGARALSSSGTLPGALTEKLLERFRVLWSAYGLPEAGSVSTLGRIGAGAVFTVGRPIANTRAYVLDDGLDPVPIGLAGELVLAGAGIASGYAGEHAPAAAAFIEDPFASGPAYRTGATARWRQEGRLELL